MSYHRYLCGCYHAVDDIYGRGIQTYLPLLNSNSHTALVSTSYRTKLKQSFNNPSAKDLKECIYTFPLYDGVALVSFTCHVGDRTLHGVVKEKNKAKEVYDEAVARGETAGLLSQLPEASDVFSTKLGNIPAGETVTVDIEYVGELKQETETNGIRFTIPTYIAPRYGHVIGGSKVPSVGSSGIKIVVDAQMPAGSTIQGLQSPSHPIAIALGKTSSEPAEAEASLSKASASLSIASTSLDKDFVLIVLAKEAATPKAVLETHPRIKNQKALMVTLVPKFSLPPSRPEIVFVADRSGSMLGNIPILISAMKVFLKSLPLGVKFNICSFGSRHEFLWPKSKTYAQDTLAEAMAYVGPFAANFGGTETFSAIKATVEQRYTDIPLEVMLLTDGDIWQQDELFRYLNEEVDKSQGNIRVFPLGIGSGVSHALIEGVARAGNGFAQAVQNGEKLDNRVVRMLKGALSPHITDYTLEVKYKLDQPVGDDFEMIEKFDKVTDGFKVSATEVHEEEKQKEQKPISLFDSEVDPDAGDNNTASDKSGQDRYAHLPVITLPKLLQAPHKMPPLFPFTRASVYLLISPAHGSSEPESVILRGTSPQGPLELEIHVDVLPEPAETIHQLAAKKAVQDLEEGRGWIYEAKDEKGVPIKERYPSRFDDMVEREAVRLGTMFGIAGKWCSFVAVADHGSEDEGGRITGKSEDDFFSHPCYNVRKRPADLVLSIGNVPSQTRSKRVRSSYNRKSHAPRQISSAAAGPPPPMGGNLFGASMVSRPPAPSAGGLYSYAAYAPPNRAVHHSMAQPMSSGFGSSQGPVTPGGARPSQPYASQAKKSGRFGGFVGALTGSSRSASTSSSAKASLFGVPSPTGATSGGLSGMAAPQEVMAVSNFDAPQQYQQYQQHSSQQPLRATTRSHMRSASLVQEFNYCQAAEDDDDDSQGFGSADVVDMLYYTKSAGNGPKPTDWSKASDDAKVHKLIALQDFVGFWEYAADMYGIMSLKGKNYKNERTQIAGEEAKVWTTVLVIAFLEQKMKTEEGVWDLVVEKARSWLEGMEGEKEREALEAEARAVFA